MDRSNVVRPTIEQRLEMAQYVRAKEPGLLCDLGMCSVIGCDCRPEEFTHGGGA